METARQFIERHLDGAPGPEERTRRISASLIAWSAGLGDAGFQRAMQDMDGFGRDAFRMSARSLREEWGGTGIRIAFWAPSWSYYTNQLLAIAKGAAADARFRTCAVISGEFNPVDLGTLDWFLDQKFLHAPDPSWLGELEFIQVMVGTEGCFDRSGFPRQVRRVALAHTLRDPLLSSLLHFGSGIVYDYILCPSLDEGKLAGLAPDCMLDSNPIDLVEHASPVFTAIPAGSPKIDAFRHSISKWSGHPNDIVYHLSIWEMESKFVHENVRTILATLLEDFPDRNVLFRPFPKDAENPQIQSLLQEFGTHPRFKHSTASSYVDDYLQAALLIHHMSTSSEIFGLATGRPVLQIVGPGDPPGNPFGTLMAGIEGLSLRVRELLDASHSTHGGNGRGAGAVLANPGRSLEYVLDSLERIAAGGRAPEWLSIPLFAPQQPPNSRDRFLHSALKAFQSQRPSRSLGRELRRRYPDSWTFNFLAAVGLKNDGHPGFLGLYAPMWLDSLECAVRCLELTPDEPVGNQLSPLFEEWFRENVPDMVSTLFECLRCSGTPEQRSRLDACMSRMPSPPNRGALPQLVLRRTQIRNQREAARNGIVASLSSEVAELRLEAGITALENGKIDEARLHFGRVLELDQSAPGPWIGLAHCALSLRDVGAFADCCGHLERFPPVSDTLRSLREQARRLGIAVS